MSVDNTLTLEKISSGKKLLRFAWIIEIIAAFIGLIIAWSMGYETYLYYISDNGSFPAVHLFDLILAALPFVMVASVELLKIPFCKLIYLNNSFRVRFFYTIVLVLVTFITFETLSTGFERNFHNISMKVSIPQEKLDSVNNEVQLIADDISKYQQKTQDTVRNETNLQIANAEKRKETAITALNAQKEQFFQQGNSVFINKKNNIEGEIKRLEERRDKQVKKIEEEMTKVGESARENQLEKRELNKKQIIEDEKKLVTLKNDLKKLGFFENKQPLRDKIAILEVKISKLQEENLKVGLEAVDKLDLELKKFNEKEDLKLENLYAQLSAIESQLALDTKYQKEIKTLDQKIIEREKEYGDELKVIENYNKQEIADLNKKSEKIAELEEKLSKLKIDRSKLISIISKAYENTQIYRIAKSWYADEIIDGLVSERQISIVAAIWFGSLAGIVSCMGIFLAFGSFIFMYSGPGFEEINKRGPGPVRRALISALEARKRKYNEPKIVEKIKKVEVEKIVKEIVEVDKVVYKEVPKEVVRKEVIHVPIYTNDPDLLKFGTTKVKDILDDK